MALVQKANEGRFGLSRQEEEQVQLHSGGQTRTKGESSGGKVRGCANAAGAPKEMAQPMLGDAIRRETVVRKIPNL